LSPAAAATGLPDSVPILHQEIVGRHGPALSKMRHDGRRGPAMGGERKAAADYLCRGVQMSGTTPVILLRASIREAESRSRPRRRSAGRRIPR